MISLERLRSELSIPPAQDHELTLLKSMVINLWEKHTGLLWNLRSAHVEVFRLIQDPRPHTVFLELQPATTITTVEERSASGSSAWTTTDADNYDLIGRRRLENYAGRWSALVRVTYDGGVSSAAEDIQKALIIQAQFLARRLTEDKIAIRSQNFEGGSGVFEDAYLHPFFKQLAEQHAAPIP